MRMIKMLRILKDLFLNLKTHIKYLNYPLSQLTLLVTFL